MCFRLLWLRAPATGLPRAGHRSIAMHPDASARRARPAGAKPPKARDTKARSRYRQRSTRRYWRSEAWRIGLAQPWNIPWKPLFGECGVANNLQTPVMRSAGAARLASTPFVIAMMLATSDEWAHPTKVLTPHAELLMPIRGSILEYGGIPESAPLGMDRRVQSLPSTSAYGASCALCEK